MGFSEWSQLREEFDGRRNTVREIFERLFNRLFTTDDAALAEVNIVLAFRPDADEIERVMAAHSTEPRDSD